MEGIVNVRRSNNGSTLSPLPLGAPTNGQPGVLSEESFQRMISLERKRSERSRKPFLLMLVDTGGYAPSERTTKVLSSILSALSVSTRETDVTGWYKHCSVVGVMFTEIGLEDRASVLGTMITRVSETLKSTLSFEQFNQVSLSFHLFPEDWNHDDEKRPTNPRLYPDLEKRDESRKLFSGVKRVMDIGGSLLALILFSPLCLAIALAIKLTSRGPILFRQRRIGQHGASFTFLKFRSMRVGNDASTHREYVQKLIAGKAERHPTNGNGDGVYKITKDSRITKVGMFLRRTSLDELPQFINVLRGEMSLVGPRPPVPYEVEAYDFWHRRRVLEAKPGITGLWQVSGRSRVKFDDMVRLDLQYAQNWSLWMDLKILLRTPRAVLGEGAY
jgi:lipopolysaccharide/colanic/teichoic acid biosynthesis glycosyltransferase